MTSNIPPGINTNQFISIFMALQMSRYIFEHIHALRNREFLRDLGFCFMGRWCLKKFKEKSQLRRKIFFGKHADKLEYYPNFLHRKSVKISFYVIISNTTPWDSLWILSLKGSWSPFWRDRHGTVCTHLLCQSTAGWWRILHLLYSCKTSAHEAGKYYTVRELQWCKLQKM